MSGGIGGHPVQIGYASIKQFRQRGHTLIRPRQFLQTRHGHFGAQLRVGPGV